jgi:hypothetical protein
MKILVITFSRGLNPGTFMQALGVKTGLLKLFPSASISYLNFPDFKWNPRKRNRQDNFWHVLNQKIFALFRLIRYRRLEAKTFNYTRRIDLFSYKIFDAKELLGQFDLVVVGSDTILEKAKLEKGTQYGLNWCGNAISKVPHVLFAASASPANFVGDKIVVEQLKVFAKGFRFIGLRDDLTINVFQDLLGVDDRRIYKQPDPSYLLNLDSFELPSYYQKKILKLKQNGKRVCYYNFSPDFPYRRELALRIKEEGYNLITSVYNPSADLCIDTIIPNEWAGIFKYCDVVVTERFHDTLFALRNACPVVAIDWDPSRFSSDKDSKTYRILNDYCMGEWHFNLKLESQIEDVVRSVVKLQNRFDKDEIKKRAKDFESYAHYVLSEMYKSIN